MMSTTDFPTGPASTGDCTAEEAWALETHGKLSPGELLAEAALERDVLRFELAQAVESLEAARGERDIAMAARTQDRALITMLRRQVADLQLHNHGLRMIVASLSKLER